MSSSNNFHDIPLGPMPPPLYPAAAAAPAGLTAGNGNPAPGAPPAKRGRRSKIICMSCAGIVAIFAIFILIVTIVAGQSKPGISDATTGKNSTVSVSTVPAFRASPSPSPSPSSTPMKTTAIPAPATTAKPRVVASPTPSLVHRQVLASAFPVGPGQAGNVGKSPTTTNAAAANPSQAPVSKLRSSNMPKASKGVSATKSARPASETLGILQSAASSAGPRAAVLAAGLSVVAMVFWAF